jgi:CelD/BcsL family acetyltransferase involved in cellulose biosynthesis
MHFQKIIKPEEILRYEKEIEELYNNCNVDNPHISFDWIMNWWKVYGYKYDPFIILIWDNDSLLGFAPLMHLKSKLNGVFNYTKIEFIGTGLSDFSDIITIKNDKKVKEDLLNYLIKENIWDEISLINIPFNSNTISLFNAFYNNTNIRLYRRVNTKVLCIDLLQNTWEEYYKGLSKNHRRELKKRFNKINKGGNWKCEFNPACESNELFSIFQVLNSGRSKQKGWISPFDDPDFHKFFLKFIAAKSYHFETLFSILTYEGMPISYTLGFVNKNIYYHWSIGFDLSYADYSPNKIHHQLLIEECFNRGYAEFNFMRGESGYKFLWTKKYTENNYVVIYNMIGLKGLITRTVLFLKRLKKILKSKISLF